MISVGVYDDLEAATNRTASIDRSFEPRPAKVSQYSRWYDVYKESYEAMFGVWDHRVDAMNDLVLRQASTAE